MLGNGCIIAPLMPQVKGSRLGLYEIVSAIGAGGMGEVYRARDTRLGRDVALKVLPEAFAADAERMGRFEREAKVLASLNHPNIATIHGMEESGNLQALVMELVEGQTLADRIAQGPIPLDEALPIAKQICEGFEYAHERGIVHRDLKPANVKITPDGAVKILDFGLAKALEGEGATASDPASSPTMSRLATQAGIILGTAAYMSPEQAKGKPVDRRADIWAFGCVLYEMLTGKHAFDGETVTDVLAAVVMKDPDWSLLPESMPPAIRKLLARCLKKDAKQRLQAIGEARITIEEALSGAGEETLPVERVTKGGGGSRIAWAVAVLSVAAAVALGALLWLRAPAPAVPLQASVLGPKDYQLEPYRLAISPDGTKIAYVAYSKTSGGDKLWVRALNSTAAQPLAGTDGASSPFFWSPDSKSIGFFADGTLKKVDASGGPVISLADAKQAGGGSWGKDGNIVFAPELGSQGLFTVSSAGGPVTSLMHLDPSQGQRNLLWPFFLPDGRHLLFYAWAAPGKEGGIYLLDLQTKEVRLLRRADTKAEYAGGYLLFVEGGNLMAQRFSLSSFALSGEAEPVAEDVQYDQHWARAAFSAGSEGLLAYVRGGAESSVLKWYARDGKEAGQVGSQARFSGVSLSPDGTKVATSVLDAQGGKRDIWLYDVTWGTATRLTTDGLQAQHPVWSKVGSRIFYYDSGPKGSGIYSISNSGLGGSDFLDPVQGRIATTSLSPDGSSLLYMKLLTGSGQPLLWIHPLAPGKKDYAFPLSKLESGEGQFSPDGRWLAYESEESGRPEIYAVPFPSLSSRWQISTGGGAQPRWRGDGKEIYYIAPDANLMSVPIEVSGNSLKPGKPEALFRTDIVAVAWDYIQYDVTRDGQKFLVNSRLGQATQSITIYANWQGALAKK